MATHLIVLAAGQGTRMKSVRPKVMHEIGGAPMFVHALRSGDAVSPDRRVLVVGHGAEEVADAAQALDPALKIAIQAEQKGTAHAVAAAREALEGAKGDAFVLYGDTPFIRAETLQAMQTARAAGHAVVVLGFEAADPGRYGRLVMAGDQLEKIVEYKDADEATRALTFCNSGVIAADVSVLFDLIDAVGNSNAAGEFYLTDIVQIARDRGLSATAVACPEAETQGINTRADLAAAEATFQAIKRAEVMAAGVTLIAPDTVQFSYDTALAADVVVEPNVVFASGVSVETGARIRAFSHLEGTTVGKDAIIGPYARLRPGAEIGPAARIGNFVEVKNATLGPGAKANHLTYLGDASIGAGTNIGAGTITCNYDGVFKHRTEIGENAFIGSDTMLVAPVKVGDEAMTATGGVITEDVPPGAMALARAPQSNKPGLAKRLFARLRAAKEKQRGK